MFRPTLRTVLVAPAFLWACSSPSPGYDVIIRGGTVYDGSGDPPRTADVAIAGETIAGIGDFAAASATTTIDAAGLAVSPGFINMLSWATESLLVDGRSLSDIRQGVTLEVFGEGNSMGPLNPEMKTDMLARQGDVRFDVPWTTLGEYLDHLVERGVATNVASYVGATTVRVHELGHADRPPTSGELGRMQDLVRDAMREGALGVGSSLIYAPAFYADTDELIALASAAGEFGGGYISHLRSEGNRLLEAVDELLTIAREAGVRAEIYHLKAAGSDNWGKLDEVIERVEGARAEGLEITADMYTYTAGSTGLDAAMPPWIHEGGHAAMIERLRDPATRERIAEEMRTPTGEWENLLLAAGSPDRALLVGFRQDSLKYLTGKSLAEVGEMRGTGIEETAMDLVVQDDSRVGTVYFMMSEDNVRRQIAIPWMSFGSDAGSLAPEEPFVRSSTHPRAYGNFSRLLGRYVRDERIIPLEEAVRKLTSLPAANLRLEGRGRLAPGYFADVVIFDPATIADHATFEEPHRLATGMRDVFVNGVQVLSGGEPTGATPGQVVRGPGWEGADGFTAEIAHAAEAGARAAPGDDTGPQIALVTGSTSGLGRELALRLGARGHHVIVHGRNEERGAEVVDAINAAGPGSARFYRADLASFADTRAFAESLLADYDRLDILINNAGFGSAPDERLLTEDGHEYRFQVNYLSTFLLTHMLMPRLVASAPSRIVNVSSGAQTPIDFDDVMIENDFSGRRAYAQSKLAQILFTHDLADELEGTGIVVGSLHPATYMPTGMVRRLGATPRSTIAEGADAVMQVVDSEDFESGQYFSGLEPSRANAQAYDVEARARLRRLSEELTGIACQVGRCR